MRSLTLNVSHASRVASLYICSTLPTFISLLTLANNAGLVWTEMTCNLQFKACKNLRHAYLMF